MYIQYIQFQEIIHTVKFNSLESTLKVYFNVEESNQSVTIQQKKLMKYTNRVIIH